MDHESAEHQKYDIVILGDSRSYRGLSPAEMSKTLACANIYNFGFSGGGLNPEIYAVGTTLLDKKSRHLAIVLGVTPDCLMESTANNKQYQLEHNRPRSAYLERVYINPLASRFAPFDCDNLLYALTGRRLKGYIYANEYVDDGWVASNKFPEDPHEAIDAYRKEMVSGVSEALKQSLFNQTRKWTASGVRVFAFRPPTTMEMVDLENNTSGFDETAFCFDFEKAGGTWVPVDLSQYHSYDGSHLADFSALKLSRYIATEMIRAGFR